MINHRDTKTPSEQGIKGSREKIPIETDAAATQIVDAALGVHRELGPGLLESVCESCLAYELELRGLKVLRQVSFPVQYKGVSVDAGLRLDLVVDGCVVVELKAVEALLPVHSAQVLTYLKLSGLRFALLINFNVPLIKDGIKRMVL